MVQFARRRRSGWTRIALIVLIIAAIIAYLYFTTPTLFASLPLPR